MKTHMDILDTAGITLADRADQYGPAAPCFDRASKLASIILNKPVSRYDVAMVLHALKLARLQENRANPDNYVDGINYLAFGGEFIQAEESIIIAAENDVAAFIRGNPVSDAISTKDIGKDIGKDKLASVAITAPTPKEPVASEPKAMIL